jgi:hypothetical protein
VLRAYFAHHQICGCVGFYRGVYKNTCNRLAIRKSGPSKSLPHVSHRLVQISTSNQVEVQEKKKRFHFFLILIFDLQNLFWPTMLNASPHFTSSKAPKRPILWHPQPPPYQVLAVAVLRSKRNLLRIQSPQWLLQLYSTPAMVCLSRSSTMCLNPYTVYYQVALKIVDCQ